MDEASKALHRAVPVPLGPLVPLLKLHWLGAAFKRMKTAKFSMLAEVSDNTAAVVPAGPRAPKVVRRLLMLRESGGAGGAKTWSSGTPLGVHCPFPMVLSFWKSSLVTPISTLAASPAKSSNDLFCAFQPKRLMVWSFPLRLNLPLMPKTGLKRLMLLATASSLARLDTK